MKRVFIIENPMASRSTPRGVETVRASLDAAGGETDSVVTEGARATPRGSPRRR